MGKKIWRIIMKSSIRNEIKAQITATARYPASSRIVQPGAHCPRLPLAHTGRTVQIAAVFICFLLAAPRIPQESGALLRRITGFCIRGASEPYPRCIRTASKLYPFCPHAKSCRTPTWERQLLCIVFLLYRRAFYGGQFSYTNPPAG